MSTADPAVRRAGWLVIAGLATLPVAVLVTAAVPTGARPAVFLAGAAVVCALSLTGGIRARQALLSETPSQVRAVVVAWLGLLVGITVGVFCLWSAIGLLA